LDQHAGFPQGYGRGWGDGTVSLSTRHTLADQQNAGGPRRRHLKIQPRTSATDVEAGFDVRLTPTAT